MCVQQQLTRLNDEITVINRCPTRPTHARVLIMASNQGKMNYMTSLDAPMPFPENSELTYMTVSKEESVTRPPGIHSLRQWGQMVLGGGKHKGMTFQQAIEMDPEYGNWIKNHQVTSEWAKSFQEFSKAWQHMTMTNVQAPVLKSKAMVKTAAQPPRSVWSEDEEELVVIPSTASSTMTSGKRPAAEETAVPMTAEISTEHVQQLQTQIAVLQRQLAMLTKNAEGQ